MQANGIGYLCQDDEGHINGINIEDCDFYIIPKTKIWGVDFSEGLATHAYSMPYNLMCKNVEKLFLKNTVIKWGKAKFSNTFKKEDREKAIKILGAEKMQELEPLCIKAIKNINSNIKIENCEIEDYKYEG